MIDELKIAFAMQKKQAGKRNVEFNLTYEEWLNIWESSGHLHERGCKKGQYCMSRYGDTGSYQIDNVFIQLATQNVSDAKKGKDTWNKGRPMSLEQKQLISAAKKGKPWSEIKRLAHQEKIQKKETICKQLNLEL